MPRVFRVQWVPTHWEQRQRYVQNVTLQHIQLLQTQLLRQTVYTVQMEPTLLDMATAHQLVVFSVPWVHT